MGPDGNIWYVTGLDVARVAPSGQVTLFPYNDTLTNGQGTVSAITTGPDGNLWFTMLNGDKVGRITPAGDVTEFDTPAQGMIVTGSDGDLWFRTGQRSISQMTTGGVVTTYSTTGLPQELAEGPDGNIWFTETGGLIGRLTPDGQLTEFSVPTTGGTGWRAIISGADGNLWFFGDGQVGRITTSGVVTQWPASAAIAGDGVGQMTRTSDGRIWFVTGDPLGSGCSDFAELNPDGTESVWRPTPCIGFSKAITVGPDGNLWLSSGAAGDSQGLAVIQPPSS